MCHRIREPAPKKVRAQQETVVSYPQASPKRTAPAVASVFRRIVDRLRGRRHVGSGRGMAKA